MGGERPRLVEDRQRRTRLQDREKGEKRVTFSKRSIRKQKKKKKKTHQKKKKKKKKKKNKKKKRESLVPLFVQRTRPVFPS